MPRGKDAKRGRGYKPTRGGGHQFSRDLRPLDADGISTSMWTEGTKKESSSDNDNDSEEDEDEEESSEEASDGNATNVKTGTTTTSLESKVAAASLNKQPENATQSRIDRRAAKKQAKKGSDDEDSDDADLINPNHVPTKTVRIDEPEREGQPMNRRMREEMEKAAAQEKYRKLHEAGKTDQAKTDLARLAKIRAEREQAAATRKAEAELKAQHTVDRLVGSSRKKH